MVELVDAYATFMANTDIPKLFINADPGSILVDKGLLPHMAQSDRGHGGAILCKSSPQELVWR